MTLPREFLDEYYGLVKQLNLMHHLRENAVSAEEWQRQAMELKMLPPGMLQYKRGNMQMDLLNYLKQSEFEAFEKLVSKKFMVGQPWTDDDQNKLEKYERLLLQPDPHRYEKLQRKIKERNREDSIMFARVKIISTGQVGTGGISYDFGPYRQSMILLDEDDGGDSERFDAGFAYSNDRDDLQMLCSVCDAPAASQGRCAGCQRIWYCGKDCQISHWSKHKRLCREKKPKLVQIGHFQAHPDVHKLLLQNFLKASKNDSDAAATDEAVKSVQDVLDRAQEYLDALFAANRNGDDENDD